MLSVAKLNIVIASVALLRVAAPLVTQEYYLCLEIFHCLHEHFMSRAMHHKTFYDRKKFCSLVTWSLLLSVAFNSFDNTLAYYATLLITALKGFLIYNPGTDPMQLFTHSFC